MAMVNMDGSSHLYRRTHSPSRVFLALLLYRRRSTEVNQTLHNVWLFHGLVQLYIHFAGLTNEILRRANFTLHQSFAFFICSVTARHSSSGHQPNFAAWYKKWDYANFAPQHFQQRTLPIFRGLLSRWA